MPKLTITFVSKRKWVGVVITVGAALSVLIILIGISMLPAILFGTTLTSAEAEESIRSYLLSQAIVSFHQRSAACGEKPEALHARYSAEVVASHNALEFVSVEVDTVVFSAFKISRSFVAEVVMRGEDGKHSTRYYCFVGKYLTRECSRWNWLVAW